METPTHVRAKENFNAYGTIIRRNQILTVTLDLYRSCSNDE